jgi:hypothetical protein
VPEPSKVNPANKPEIKPNQAAPRDLFARGGKSALVPPSLLERKAAAKKAFFDCSTGSARSAATALQVGLQSRPKRNKLSNNVFYCL